MTAGASTEIPVSEMLRAGSALSDIEDFIEHQPLSEEERTVLWLRAWSERPMNLLPRISTDTDEPR